MPTFDYKAAKAAGATDREIMEFLSAEQAAGRSTQLLNYSDTAEVLPAPTTRKPSPVGSAIAGIGGLGSLAGQGLASASSHIRDVGLGLGGLGTGVAGAFALRELLRRRQQATEAPKPQAPPDKVSVRSYVRSRAAARPPKPKLPPHLIEVTAKDAQEVPLLERKVGQVIRRSTYERLRNSAKPAAVKPEPSKPPAATPKPAPVAAAAQAEELIPMTLHEGGQKRTIYRSKSQKGATGPELAERWKWFSPEFRERHPEFAPKPTTRGRATPSNALGILGLLLNASSMPEQMQDSDALLKEFKMRELRRTNPRLAAVLEAIDADRTGY